ncbi:unnamed protein product [Amoebophrya sp. A120]|nr:unnamed protein product [Amoebophrya sp. A120]|eukprot:GSA120T00014588001.1
MSSEIWEQHKQNGNEHFKKKEYEKAIEQFSKAIELKTDNAILFSNRAACYQFQKQYDKALADAKKATALDPKWWKGWSRRAGAEQCLEKYADAKNSYERAIQFIPAEEGGGETKTKKSELEAELKKCKDKLIQGNMEGLKFTDIQKELRQSLERLSLEQLRDEARSAGILDVSNQDSSEELIRVILAADAKAADDERRRRQWNKWCICCKRGDQVTPEDSDDQAPTYAGPQSRGEKYLVQRKKRMQALQEYDINKLKKMCKSKRIEYERWWQVSDFANAIIQLEEKQAADPDYQLQKNLKILGVVSFLILVVAVVLILIAA